MNRRRGFHSTPEEALRASVEAIGGLQEVGHALKPEIDPATAGNWLGHCLTASKRDKLSLRQIALVFRKAYSAGEHEGFASFADQLGYRVVAIEPQAELEELSRRAESAANEAMSLSREVIARMQASHLKVES